MPNRLAIAIRAAFIGGAIAVGAPALAAQTVPAAAAAQSTPAVVKHTVKPGDTLWDIAKYYLKDPFRWPEVFHANTDIVKNPHWIYPGQILTIDGAAVKPEIAARVDSSGFIVAQIQTRAKAPTVFAERDNSVQERMVAENRVPPALTVRQGEYDAAPYVVAGAADPASGQVIGPVDVPALGLTSDAGYRTFDRIYITAPPGMPLSVGQQLVVARTGSTIVDVGHVVEPTGIIRVDSVAAGNRGIAVIVRQFSAITQGQRIVAPGRSFEATTTRPVVGSYPVRAKLLWIQGSPRLPSVQTYLVLGAGEAQGVRIGDQFTLFDDRTFSDGTQAPLASTASITVVRVTPTTATGIVEHQTQPEIRVGMPMRLTARMP
jgi:LysM repeat protein